jgi:hypothetical protein
MTTTQSFGRRGHPPEQLRRAPPPSVTRRASPQPAHNVPPELVAAITRRDSEKVAPATRGDEIVQRSFRAAILAGFVVAILNAAANATFTTQAQASLGPFSIGAGNAPMVIALLLAALWSGARTSALCLLVAHRLLAALRRTSPFAYAIAGGGIALAFGLLMQSIGRAPEPGGLGLEALLGAGAGLFYRLFAGTQRNDDKTTQHRI